MEHLRLPAQCLCLPLVVINIPAEALLTARLEVHYEKVFEYVTITELTKLQLLQCLFEPCFFWGGWGGAWM